jgi:hypothetical protein
MREKNKYINDLKNRISNINTKNEFIDLIKNSEKEKVLDLIRHKLRFEPHVLSQIRGHLLTNDKEHKRFEMSGYDGEKSGSCVIHNQSILNIFAYLGIYDYTEYLYLDFYKGYPTLYMKYWGDSENIEYTFGDDNVGTVEIIYQIFQLTILSNKNKRRR